MQNIGACSIGQKWSKEIYLALRVVTGFVFLYHGHAKIFGAGGIEGVIGFFTQVGIPLPGLMAPLVSYGEFLGGIALILGLFTHWIAKLNVLIMLGAIFFVHLAKGYNVMEGGYEYQLLLLIVNLFIASTGAGIYSLDAKRMKSGTPALTNS